MHSTLITDRLSPQAFRVRLGLIAVLGLAALVALAVVPRFPQDTEYHQFADQRPLWGVPHALNVLSNAPFVLVGVFGLIYLLTGGRLARLLPTFWERWAFLTLFAFVAVTGVGSAYYHAQPSNDTLFWDRLPLTVVFMTFFALILAERVHPRLAPWLWLPLVAVGVFGVSHWHWTEQQGAGDVRLYALVQFFPMLVIPILLVAFPARYYRTADLFAILGWYVLAKLLELGDGWIYTANGAVSGHTLKHVVAALGALWILVLLRRRFRADPTLAAR